MKRTINNPTKKQILEALSISDKDLTGKFVLLKEKALGVPYRAPKYRVVKATGGFGCSPVTIGRALFVEYSNGSTDRWNRGDVERFATEEEIVAAGWPGQNEASPV
jgi:hypothetical protein